MAERARRSQRLSPVAALSDAELQERALRYLDRFDSTAARLRQVLYRHVQRATGDADLRREGCARVDAVVQRLAEAKLIDDARFATTSALGLRQRGRSQAAIRQKLRSRGVAAEDLELALSESLAECTELDAAREYVRRRGLGPHRPPDERRARAQRDLAALARAGFGSDVARRALEADDDSDPTP